MQLEKTFRDLNAGDIKIICGDLNAKVVSNNTHGKKIMGIGTMNGELFADFC